MDFGVYSDCQLEVGDKDLPVSVSSAKIKCVWLELLTVPPDSSPFKYLSHTLRYLPSSGPCVHWLRLSSQWIPAITHVVVLIASGRQVHVSYTEGIQRKSRMVYSIIENQHGLMSWPLGFEKW